MKESGEVTREELMLFTALWEKRSLTAAAEQLGEGEENFVGDSEIIALGGASNETKDRPLG